jgi:hypothetical protein
LAECDRCDVYFGFHPDEVYSIPLIRLLGLRPASPVLTPLSHSRAG